jgi:hypothetical protein
MADRLTAARDKVGELKLKKAFNSVTFVYGTQGRGSVIVKGLKAWAGRAKAGAVPNPADQRIEKVIERELNLFDPGRRAQVYLAGGYQMMDMYYGQAGNDVYKLRDPVIAEFVHYAMGFKTAFTAKETGRDAYMSHFKTQTEGWRDGGPANAAYGISATKEISRIIRWGIQTMGGKLIFEGRELFYSQVFLSNSPRVSDTDLEARELFKFFAPNASQVSFGKGKIIFNWAGKETVPTKYHFMTNWKFGGMDKDGKPLMHKKSNIDAQALSFVAGPLYLPIWNNFADVPITLAGVDKAKLLQFVEHHGPLAV